MPQKKGGRSPLVPLTHRSARKTDESRVGAPPQQRYSASVLMIGWTGELTLPARDQPDDTG